MFIYFMEIFLITIICIWFSNRDSKKSENRFLFLVGFIMFIVMAIRDIRVGTDTSLYCMVFRNAGRTSDIFNVSDASVLYAIYNKILYNISNGWNQIIIIMNSFIIVSLFIIFIKRNSCNVIVSTLCFILFYHYFNAFNIARQYISILLVANSIYYINKDRNLFKFLFFVIIAILVHSTAIIFLPIGLLMFFKQMNSKSITIISIFTFIAALSSERILNLFLTIFPRYEFYLHGRKLLYETGNGGHLTIVLVYIFIFAAAVYIKKYSSKNVSEEWNQHLLLLLIAIEIGILSNFSTLIGRIELYFSIFAVILIPLVLERFTKKRQKVLICVVFYSVMMIPVIAQVTGNIAGICPYNTFF